ncbi:MAG: efflux RND transporter periplasmic adaptor subunit [Verrucomicrobiae bacterium]|nr:efflux RND transporter periplasmic adaptor subunit [Verrucomicrobiae bacterium]
MKRISVILVAAVGALLIVAGCSKKESVDPNMQIQKQGYYYTCSMHPQLREPKPGPCPICQMPLVKETLQKTGSATNAMSHAEFAPGTVMISPEKQQMIGVKTDEVRRQKIAHTIRATGTFEHDETKMAKIAPRFSGWVRELFVNYEGQHVEKGDPLLKVYSPDLVATENEYLIALRQVQQLKDSPSADSRESAKKLLESTRRRLELWEIGDEEIRALEERGKASDELTLRSPVSGHVTMKEAVQGKAFNAGETLYEIADLTHLWMHVFVYEADMPLIKIGQPARVVLPYRGNEIHESKVAFIYPHIEATTRRGELRLEVDNPKHELHPDMWANVEIATDTAEQLVVPSSAVIDTGERFVAFVDRGEGMLEPRVLKIGKRTDDFYEVLDGVKEGEKVVTRALFLVDSESQLKGAIAGMGGHEH